MLCALRLQRELGAHSLGLMATHVDRPWLQREANVVGVDHRWKAGDKVTVMASVVGSDIRDDNTVDVGGVPTRVADDSHDTGATLLVITHDAELAARCGRVITIGDGRIASDVSK